MEVERIGTGRAAQICGVTSKTLLRLARDGKVPGAAELDEGLWRFDVKRITQWAEQAKRRGVPLKEARDSTYKAKPSAIDLIRIEARRNGLDFGLGLDFVYFARSENGGRIKIGKATNPAARIATLRRSSPVDLRLLGAIPGNLEIEKLIHAHFAKERAKGEWFKPTKRLLRFIDQAIRDHGIVDGPSPTS